MEINTAMILMLLRLLMGTIFAGWVSLWFLIPTQLWSKKWHQVEQSVNKTFFGYNGVDFVVFAFPMIAMSTVVAVYLYLQSKYSGHRTRKGRFGSSSALYNPLFIRSPLGILSGFEIIAMSLFTFLLAWTFYARISNDYKKLVPVKTLKLNVWQLKFYRVATRCGLLAEVSLAFLLFPVLRVFSIFRLLGIQFEASVRYHTWLGTSTMFFATLHGGCNLSVWGISHHIHTEIWKWQREGRIYLAGEITLLVGLIIWISSIPQIRRKRFEVFYYTHHLYAVFLVFFLFHVGDKHFYMIFSGVVLFALDKLLRIIQSSRETSLLSAKIFPCRTIELTIPKDPGLSYEPTSIIFMKIATISKFQWHPFSISSSSTVDNDKISVMIKCDGWWTNALHELLYKESHLTEQVKSIPVAVEGPYGPTTVDFLRHDTLILVAGGIGITPFLSSLLDIASAKASHPKSRFASNVQLIYVVKSSQELSLLSSISPMIHNQSAELDNWQFKLHLFVTQEEKHEPNLSELLNRFSQEQRLVRFSTNGSNSRVLGGIRNPLSLAAISGITSFIFLFFLCFFNHIFIHPEREASKGKIPSTTIDLLLLSSFSIALVSSTLMAFILRQQGHKNKDIPLTGQRQYASMQPTTVGATGSVERHEVHFGCRPNFSNILSTASEENGGSEVSVVVCGPESMRESVALACRQSCHEIEMSAAKKNKPLFRFHSLNFTL